MARLMGAEWAALGDHTLPAARLIGRGLVQRFPGTVAVAGVEVRLKAGQVLGVMGPNGAGKTTLLDLLSGSRSPDEGRVSLDGRDITRLPAHLRARLGMARTVQRPAWFPSLTVLENVMLGASMPGASAGGGGRGHGPSGDRGAGWGRGAPGALARRRALEELERVGLAGLAGRPGHEASSAARKLGELARVAAMDPTVVLLDEPSAGHDPQSLRVLVDSVRRWAAGGAAVLLVDHDRDLVEELCPVVLYMREGRFVETRAR